MKTVREKESGIELLRTISICLILVVHIINLVLEPPNHNSLINSPLNTVTKVFFNSLSIICVDVFIVISGWFGIHASIKGILKLVFQCIFYALFGWLLSLYLGYSEFILSEFIKFFFVSAFPGWFIASYIVLYILPVGGIKLIK